MSWKDVKIGKKLYIGFGIVLVLCISIGLVSHNGLTSVAQSVEKADGANRMIKLAKDCRQAEKNYIMRDDGKYVEQLHEFIAELDEQANELKAKFEDPADIAAIEEGQTDVQVYSTGCDKWISLHKEGKEQIAEMVTAGRQCERECENLRQSQKDQMTDEFASRVGHGILLERIGKADDANRMLKYVLQMRRHEKNFLIRKDYEYVEKINKLLNDIKEQCETTKASMKRQENKDQVNAVFAGVVTYQQAFDRYQEIFEEMNATEKEMVQAAQNVVKVCNDLRQVQKGKMESAQSATITLAFGFAIGAVLIGVLVAFVIARGIFKPVSEMAAIADKIAVGDVDHSIELYSKDEIGMLAGSFRKLIDYMKELAGVSEKIADNDLTVVVEPKSERDVLGNSFKTMVTNLIGVIRELKDNATQLVSAATEVASASEQMSRGAQEQTGQTAQVSTAVEEMTATIVESSRNSSEASNQSKEASDAAAEGANVVSQTIEGMNRIANVVQESANTIQTLSKSSDQIGEIIAVIDDVADQTNLLALNAAIEAARAGEQGRGFAVVADEVRKLAERTGKATKEITDMIKGIQDDTKKAVISMEQGINEVQTGRELADNAGDSLNSIAQFSQRVMDMIQQIATAAEEQSAASEQIAKNVENIASVTKQTATGAEQSATAAEELNRQADGLQAMVSRFKVETTDQEEVSS